MWRTIFPNKPQNLAFILRFVQKNDRKFDFDKFYLGWKGVATALPALTMLLVNIGFAQPIQPVRSIKAYQAIISDQPEQSLVPLADFLSPLHQQVYYHTTSNFTGQVLYDSNYSMYFSQKAAVQLALVQDSLQKMGLDLLIYDAYRPHAVTQKMWNLVPDERYAANPAKGSGHNRGIAVDVTLINARTLQPLEMPTGYDNFSDTAHHQFMDISTAAAQNRALLKAIMDYYGFDALTTEWWHYSLRNAGNFPVYDISFSDLKQLKH